MSRFLFSNTSANGTTNFYSTDGTSSGTDSLNFRGLETLGSPVSLDPDFTAFGGETFFLGNGISSRSADSTRVYGTDGTEGTPGAQISVPGGVTNPQGLWTVNGKLLTSGTTTGGPAGLWSSSDGITFTEIAAGIGTDNLTVSNGIGFFGGDLNGNGIGGLWRTDGTATGTGNITPPGVTLDPTGFVSIGNGVTVFFNGSGPDSASLWATSGTAASTHQIVGAPFGGTIYPELGSASTGTRAVFSAIDAAGNISAWSTDGTAAGCIELHVNGPSDAAVRIPNGFTKFGSKVIFDTGYGLIATDGTLAGTVPLSSSETNGTIIVDGSKFFFNQPEVPGSSLFVSNGMVAGTKQVQVPGLQTGQSFTMTADGNQVVFAANETGGNTAIFTSDGTSAGSFEATLPGSVTLGAVNIAALPADDTSVVTLPGGAQSYIAAAGVTVQAGSGSDTITASAGAVTVLGSSGHLVFFGGTGASSVSDSAGSATIFGRTGGGQFSGGAAGGNILVSQGAAGDNTTLTGAAAGDQLFGSAAGNDVLVLGAGRELALGGGGNTTIEGDTGSSVIFTGAGPTTVFGSNAGADTIVGGTGALAVTAEKGDAIFGDAGALAVTGSTSGPDSIISGAGALSVVGHGANMLVVGSTSTSNIYTGNGASLTFAESGAIGLTGGTGPMQVVLGSGSGTFIEGSGSALYDFVNGSGGGSYVITNFRPGTDTIDLFGYTPSEQQISIGAASTTLSLSDGSKIQLLGVTNPGHSIIG